MEIWENVFEFLGFLSALSGPNLVHYIHIDIHNYLVKHGDESKRSW